MLNKNILLELLNESILFRNTQFPHYTLGNEREEKRVSNKFINVFSMEIYDRPLYIHNLKLSRTSTKTSKHKKTFLIELLPAVYSKDDILEGFECLHLFTLKKSNSIDNSFIPFLLQKSPKRIKPFKQ